MPFTNHPANKQFLGADFGSRSRAKRIVLDAVRAAADLATLSDDELKAHWSDLMAAVIEVGHVCQRHDRLMGRQR